MENYQVDDNLKLIVIASILKKYNLFESMIIKNIFRYYDKFTKMTIHEEFKNDDNSIEIIYISWNFRYVYGSYFNKKPILNKIEKFTGYPKINKEEDKDDIPPQMILKRQTNLIYQKLVKNYYGELYWVCTDELNNKHNLYMYIDAEEIFGYLIDAII